MHAIVECLVGVDTLVGVSIQLIADQAHCHPDEICDFELQICDTQPSVIGGAMKEFIFSGRVDNLCMSFCALKVSCLFLSVCLHGASYLTKYNMIAVWISQISFYSLNNFRV